MPTVAEVVTGIDLGPATLEGKSHPLTLPVPVGDAVPAENILVNYELDLTTSWAANSAHVHNYFTVVMARGTWFTDNGKYYVVTHLEVDLPIFP